MSDHDPMTNNTSRWPSLAEIFFGRLANFWRKRRVQRAASVRRLQFQAIEPRILLSADLVFNAADNLAADDFTLRLNSASGDLELLDGETLVANQALAETSAVVINGEDGQDDSLKIDFSHGGFFSLEGGITFNGGEDGFDALEVTGGTFTSVIHTVTESGPGLSGTMIYEDGPTSALTINYTGLEPVDMSGSTVDNLVFNLPGANDLGILEDDGILGNGISQLRSQNGTPTFDTITFDNPTSSLTVNLGGDDASFTVASLPDFTRSLAINGQAGADNVTFTGATNLSSAGADLSITVGGSITDIAGTSLQVNDLATFNAGSAGSITLGDNAADTTNFGSLTFALTSNSTGAISIAEDSAMVLAGNNVGGSGAVDLFASAAVTLNGNIVTRGGAVTIFNGAPVVLGSPATVTIDTTNGGTVGTGRSIVISGTVNDDVAPTSLVLRAGTTGTVNLQGAVGGTTPISGLFVTGNVVRLPAVQTTNVINVAALGTNSFIVLNGDINTVQGASAGTVQLSGPVRLGNQVQITTDHSTGADGNVLFAPGSTINEDPNNPGPRTLTILAGSGDVTFGGAVGDVTPLQGLNIVSANDVTLEAVSTRDGGLTMTTGSAGVDTNSIALNGDIDTTLGIVAGNVLLVGPVTLANNADINAGSGTITAAGSVSFSGASTIAAATLSAGSLIIGSSGAATLNAATTTATLSLSGILAGVGTVTLTGPGNSSWTGGAYTSTGELVVGSGHTLTIGSSAEKDFGTGTLRNQGTVLWTGGNIEVVGGATNASNAGTVVNSGLFDIQGANDFGDRSVGLGILTFNNEAGATLLKSGAGPTSIGSAGGVTPNGVNFNNAGTVEVQAGALSINNRFSITSILPVGTGTSSGTFSVAAGTALHLGGNNTLTGSSVVSGAGTVFLEHGTFSTGGTWSHTGALAIHGGTATFAPAMTPSAVTVETVPGGPTTILATFDAPVTTGPVTISEGAAIFNAATIATSLELSGTGTLGGTGVVTLASAGDSSWTGGTYMGPGQLVVTSGHTLTIGGATEKDFGSGTLLNDGTVLWTGGNIEIVGSGTVLNRGLFDIQLNGGNFGDLQAGMGTLTFNNEAGAELRKSGSGLTAIGSRGGITPNGVDLNNAGMLEVLSGTLSVNHAFGSNPVPAGSLTNTGTMFVAAGATLQRTGGFTSAGLVAGSGTIDVGVGNVLINTGTVAPGAAGGDATGTLTVTGNYAQGTNGRLNIEVGSIAADGLDVLAISGAATIASAPTSTLSATLVDGFTPVNGDRFRFMTFASRSGFFGTTFLPAESFIDISDPADLELVYLNVTPAIAIDKTVDADEDGVFANTESVLEGGVGDQQADYRFVVSNTSAASTDPLTVTALTDDKLGNLMAVFLAANGGSATLGVGQSVTFFVNDFLLPAGNAGSSHVNTVSAQSMDDEGTEASASDLTVVTYADLAPTVVIDKTVDADRDGVFASSEPVLEGGAGEQQVDYQFVVTNTSLASTDPLTVVSLTDDKLGDLTAEFLTANGGSNVIAVGASITFFVSDAAVPPANAGSSHVNTVTVTAVDDEGAGAQSSDVATVTFVDATPTVTIDKTVDANGDGVFASSDTLPAGASEADYRFVVANTSLASTDPLTVVSLTDDKLGDLMAAFLAANGGSNVIAVGASVTFFMLDAAVPPGSAGQSHVNAVLVTAADDEASETQSSDVAVITYGANLSNVHYDADTDTLTFDSQGDATNAVTVTSLSANLLRIMVGSGEAIFLSGDTDEGFLLSADGTQLDINTLLVSIDLFGIDLNSGDDTLFFTNDPGNGLGSLTADGGGGSDSVTLNATSLGGSLSVTADSIVVDGILSAAAGVTLTGTGNTTILNDDIITAGGAITINDGVILGSDGTITLDTTNVGTVDAGADITLAGTVDDDALASGLELRGGTGGVVTLSSTIGSTLAPQFLTIEAGHVAVQALVTTGDQSITATGNVTVTAIGSAVSLNATGAQSIDADGTLSVQGGAGAGLSARVVAGAGQTIDAASILVSGGNVGGSSFAEILQTGALGTQEIDASSITIAGGASGENNFARIRNDGTGDQTVTVAGPLTLIGGTGGAPDLGNFAQIRAVGAQVIEAGHTTLTAGSSGFSNFAGIHSPDQDIIIHGDLTLAGGSSVAGPTSAGAARIGGIGGGVPGPTNLTLTVDNSINMTGGAEVFAGAVIGSAFQGGQTTDITIDVGGSITLDPGTVPNSGSRIGTPSAALAGGDISIVADGDITVNPSLVAGISGTVIRTLGTLNLEADTITISGQVTSGVQTVSASGGLIVKGATTGVTSQLSAAGGQTINAQFVEVVASGGSALIQNLTSGVQLIETSGMNAEGEGLAVRSLSAGTFARIAQEVLDGVQEITVTDADRMVVDGVNGVGGIAAEIRAITGTQTITVTGDGANAIAVGSEGALAGSNINSLIQKVTAGELDEEGSITIIGPAGNNRLAGILTNSLGETGPETQTISTTGTISVTGGTAPTQGGNFNSGIFHNRQGLQSVTAAHIMIHGGNAGTGNGAFVSALNGGTQELQVDGSITLTGGSGDGTSNNRAGISIAPGGSGVIASQTITGNPHITLMGGDSGGGLGNNVAFISAGPGTQEIHASSLSLTAGTGGTDNGATVTAASQTINVTGNVLVTGGASVGNAANARIGSQTGIPTDLRLHVGGDVVLTAGSGGGANLGAASAGGVTTDMLITVDGDFIADGMAAGSVRIGSPEGAVGDGDIRIHAGEDGTGDILFAGRAQLRTLGEVTLTTPGTLSLTGGSTGIGNSALIESNGNQTIEASTVILTGGSEGAADLGNFARITSVLGLQTIITDDLSLIAGASGVNNYASITGPNQDITVHDDLILTGGGSAASAITGGAARIGGLGGATPGATNLILEVGGNVELTGGSAAHAGAVIGGTFHGGQSNNITMDVDGDLTLNPSTAPDSAARIGARSEDPASGGIEITVGGAVLFKGGVSSTFAATAIRTLGNLTLEADSITINGGTIVSGTQTIIAGNGLAVAATGTNSASISATGPQTITAGGVLTVQGGMGGTNRSATIASSGGQDITAAGISLTGGGSGTNNVADIRQSGSDFDQSITVADGGTLVMQGGLGGVDNFARIRNDGVNQEIEFLDGGAIVLTGGNGPDVPPNPLDTANNFARIENRSLTGLQTIHTGTIELNGGLTGANNFTGIQAAHQFIVATRDVTLQGGSGSSNSGSRIGAVGDTSSTDVTLQVGGSLRLTGGSVSDAVIGANSAGGQDTDIVIEVDGDLIADGGTGAGGARIGSPEGAVGGGDISIDAGESIQLNGTTQSAVIRTLGDVDLHAGSTIGEIANGFIVANALTTTSTGGTSLTGPNQVAAFNATNATSGDVTLGDAGGLTVTGVSNPIGDISISTTGQMTVTGNLDSRTHDISLTASSGVFFTENAVLNVDLAGAAAEDFTTVTISGDVTLGGTLDVEEVDGFAPTSGDRFRFMTFASRTGSFDTINQPRPFYYIDESDATGLDLVFDDTPPTVTINQASGQPDPTSASPINFTVLFSEAVLGFDASDISFTGSTLGNLTASVTGGGANYTVTVTGMNGEGTVVASVVDDAALDFAGNLSFASTSDDNTVFFDNVAPTVTIDQAVLQADPTTVSPISFTVFFSEAVLGFDASDISLAGSTLSGLTASVTGSGAEYTVSVSGMVGNGVVAASIGAGAAEDAEGNASFASTSADNTVTFIDLAPSVTIDQALGQADSTDDSPISFTVLFSEVVTGFDASDVDLSASSLSGLTATVTGSGAEYTVSVNGMTGDGTVVASVVAGAAVDAAGQASFASTSTDNTVTFDAATGGVDLVGAVDWDPDDLLIPGDRERATVIVSNIGDTDLHEKVKVKLYASADDVLDASDILLDEKRTPGHLHAGDSKSVHFTFELPSTLLPGEYSLLAVMDPTDKVEESNESNNTAIGESFDFAWMFGNVPGHHGHDHDSLTIRDADGTKVKFSLSGHGTGEITIENGEWDVLVTGTNGNSVLSVVTLGGGDHRVQLDDIHVTGALGAILAPRMDLTGTLAIDGPLGAGMIIGSATDAVIAAPTILGTRFFGLTLQGIAILGDLENSQVLIGARLGVDGQLGGTGANADHYSGGNLGDLLVTGSMIFSSVRVGQNPVDGIFDNGNDTLLAGSIDSITIFDEMSDDSLFVASDLPRYARIDGEKVHTETDSRFMDEDCSIDWNGHGSGWAAGYSPFSSSRYSNFSDFLMKLY